MKRLIESLTLVTASLLLAACGGAAQPLPKAPGRSAGEPTETVPASEPAEWRAPSPSEAVAPPPPSCEAFRTASTGCFQAGDTLEALARAFGETAADKRDAALAAVQTCSGLPPGVVLALRAEAAPVQCGDVIIGQRLPSGVPDELKEALTALVHAAHLKRLVVAAPGLTPPFTKQDFAEFSNNVLNQWVVTQAQAIHQIASEGVKLNGYARGVVAVEAGLADMRFVSVVREVPLPEELAHADELREAYYSELDLALTPWKQRGRDAALVGLRSLAAAGVLVDPRVERARRLLSELYGGRRIDRLDGLVMISLEPPPQATVEQRLTAVLPTYLLEFVLPSLDPLSEGILRALIERGIPPAMRADLESQELDVAQKTLLARALIQFGQRYWRAADFRSALELLPPAGAVAEPEVQLLRGLAEALQGGPADAAEMMLRGLRTKPGFVNVETLDSLAAEDTALAAAAGFNAAYILELTPPQGEPEFWRSLAQRYSRAADRFATAGERARASELARAALDTAQVLEQRAGPERP